MNIIVCILYGIIGIAFGLKIPDLSVVIMEYKKGKDNIKKDNSVLYSNLFKISVTLFNGAVWVVTGFNITNPLIAFLIGAQITIGIILVFIDINIRIIPNELVIALFVMGIIFQLVNYGFKSFLIAVACMFVMIFVFTSVAAFVGFGKVGAGDVKLAGVMGLALGYPLIINAVGIMAIVLLIFILIGMAVKKIYLSTMLPLAPFIVSGYIFSLVALIMKFKFVY